MAALDRVGRRANAAGDESGDVPRSPARVPRHGGGGRGARGRAGFRYVRRRSRARPRRWRRALADAHARGRRVRPEQAASVGVVRDQRHVPHARPDHRRRDRLDLGLTPPNESARPLSVVRGR